MKLLNFIDKKLTFRDQESYLFTLYAIAIPVYFILRQIISILVDGWTKYHFNIYYLIMLIITDSIIVLPIIINYFRHKKRYKYIFKKLFINPKEKRVKARFDYKNFEKGKSYDIDFRTFYDDVSNKWIIDGLSVSDNSGEEFSIKHIINKFELDDIKEERRNKLKRLKWK